MIGSPNGSPTDLRYRAIQSTQLTARGCGFCLHGRGRLTSFWLSDAVNELQPMFRKHTHNRNVKFQHQGHWVFMRILAYRKIDDEFMRSCVADWVRSQKRKKLKSDREVVFPTLYGASDKL